MKSSLLETEKPMPIDLRKVLKDLYIQRERLEHVITSLEALQDGSAAGLPAQKKTNRGRKSISGACVCR
jgi:hypothetical protein